MVERISRGSTLGTPAAEVWRAIADPAGLSSWFGATVTGPMVPHRRLEFAFPDGTVRAAVVEEVEPEVRLAFRWLPFERLADGSTRRREVTRVEMTLEPAPGGTTLVVVETMPVAARVVVA